MAYKSINPFTEELMESFAQHTDAELEGVLSAANTAFLGDWRTRSYQDRAAVLKEAASILRSKVDHYAEIATLEMGKLLRESKGEVALSADILDYYADNAATMLAPRAIKVKHGEATVESFPIGTIFCIEPWNFPFYQLARVAGPHLMAGNTVIVKHASGVPRCAIAFEELFLEAGAPAGVYSNVFLSNEQAAAAILDKRVQAVALTGSERAGASVAATAGKALKKSTMELGGSDAFIVLDDADLDTAVRLAVAGRMMNTGQACAGAKRFIVPDAIADAFVERFRGEMEKLRAGDPMNDETTLGPLHSKGALDTALEQISTAVAGGAEVLLGGKQLDRKGYFLAPTILANVAPANPAFDLEFFAPVAMVFRVKSEDEAIALANNSPFGLGASIITKDISRGKRVASRLDTGMVFINDNVITTPDLPFGGIKNSGWGRELSDLGINEFVNKKLVTVT